MSRVKPLGRFATTKLAGGEGPQVVAGDNLGTATRKLSHLAAEARSALGLRDRHQATIRLAGGVCEPPPQPLAERTSRRTPQSAGSGELTTGCCIHRRQVVASRQFLLALPLVLAPPPGTAVGIGAAMAVAADLDDVAVMHQPVHRRDGHGTAGEDLIPGRERLIGGDQQ